jgi:myosin heavy subunit
MRNVIFIAILVVLAAVLFGVAWVSSSVLSGYIEQKNKPEHQSAEDSGKEGGKELPPLAHSSEGSASRTRPSSNPETEQLVQEMAKVREREENLRKQEQQLITRRKALEIIKEDIKGEREEIDKVRKELSDQVKGAGDDLTAAEKRLKDLEAKKDEEEKLFNDAKKRIYETQAVRDKGVERVGGIFDTAEPAEVAAIFERMVESGSDGLMTAAQILSRMKDRRAAAVLSAIQDKAMAADLAEKMVGLKQAAPAPAGKGARGPATDK